MSIVRSMLDSDLYKFTMGKAVLAYRQNVPACYVFLNRRPEGKFNERFFAAFQRELEDIKRLALTSEEAEWLYKSHPFLGHQYVEWLMNYRFDPSEIDADIVDGELYLQIDGPWERTIYWEVPLMSIISELFFEHCDTGWTSNGYEQRTKEKAEALTGIPYADFGTRRRRSFDTQDLVVRTFAQHGSNFVGTSNVHLAHKHNVKAIGTMAHEWIMGISALEGLRHANRHALKIWSKVFNGDLGIALTDTFGTKLFWEDFDPYLSRLFDGVRHDSGDPMQFAESAIKHYKDNGIDPNTKTIVFSDGLNTERAIQLWKELEGKIRRSFGIGTHFTNDIPESKALNMVIKLWSCDNIPVVKLSDVKTKQIGNFDALRVANWTFSGKSLDPQPW